MGFSDPGTPRGPSVETGPRRLVPTFMGQGGHTSGVSVKTSSEEGFFPVCKDESTRSKGRFQVPPPFQTVYLFPFNHWTLNRNLTVTGFLRSVLHVHGRPTRETQNLRPGQKC